ncbi:hypothetical protein BH11ACT8_BH11ACT8_12840 [soil metagenome]
MTRVRSRLLILLVLPVLLVLTGCEFTGINNQPLPLTKGGGSDDLRVTVYLENAVNLVPNSEVKVADVTVGTVRTIEFDDWQAKLTLGIEKGTFVPADAIARVGQKSLLGAEYLELAAPDDSGTSGASGTSTVAMLDGAVIPVERTGRYPETEEVLASAAGLLNGGGLEQVNTITRELNKALGGREDDVRSLIDELDTFVGTLDAQRGDIVTALEGLDRLAGTFADQKQTVARALEQLPGGIETLRDQRRRLTTALTAVADFGRTASSVIRRSREDLIADLDSVQPVLRELADAGKNLTGALGDISFPFPVDGADVVFRGDYINFFATVDVTLPTLERDFLAGTPLEGLYSAILGALPTGPVDDLTDPLLEPLDPTPGVGDGAGDEGRGDVNDLLGGLGGVLGQTPGDQQDGPIDLGGLLGGLAAGRQASAPSGPTASGGTS